MDIYRHILENMHMHMHMHIHIYMYISFIYIYIEIEREREGEREGQREGQRERERERERECGEAANVCRSLGQGPSTSSSTEASTCQDAIQNLPGSRHGHLLSHFLRVHCNASQHPRSGDNSTVTSGCTSSTMAHHPPGQFLVNNPLIMLTRSPELCLEPNWAFCWCRTWRPGQWWRTASQEVFATGARFPGC